MKPSILLLVIICALLLAALIVDTQGAPVKFSQEPKANYSRIIEIDGKPSILMPDGRVLPMGQGLNCTSSCPAVEESAGRSKLWLLAIPAAVAAVVVLWPDSSVVVSPRVPILPPPAIRPPSVDVPEISTLGLLGLGLACMAFTLRRRQ